MMRTTVPNERPSFVSGALPTTSRSEEHTSELQSPCNIVCRLLLEKKIQHMRAAGFTCRRPLRLAHERPQQRPLSSPSFVALRKGNTTGDTHIGAVFASIYGRRFDT